MKLQIGEMSSWWNSKLMKWQVDEMANWSNDKFLKLKVDEIANSKFDVNVNWNWWSGKLIK